MNFIRGIKRNYPGHNKLSTRIDNRYDGNYYFWFITNLIPGNETEIISFNRNFPVWYYFE